MAQRYVFLVKIARRHVSQLIQFVETRRIRRSNGKLHTDMESCVKICTHTCPCKSKSGVEVRLFTVNTSHSLRISKTNVLRHCFICQKLNTQKISYTEAVRWYVVSTTNVGCFVKKMASYVKSYS